MKVIAILLALGSAALVSAQAQCSSVAAAIPACGTSCLASAESAVGCSPGDFACPCSSSQAASIQTLALECVINACGAVTGLAVSSAALAVCSCVATAAAAPASSTAAATSAPASSAAAPSSSPAASSASASASASVTGSPTSSIAVYHNSTATSSLAAFTGGAARVLGAGGLVVGGFIGVMAAL